MRPLAFVSPASSSRAWRMNSLATSAVFLLSGSVGDGVERRDAGDLRIGVVDVAVQAGAAEDDDEAMLLHRLDEDFDAGDLYVAQFDRERRAFFGGDAAGAAVADVAAGVERAEVRADGDVALLQREADAGGFERAAADQVLERIVAEQAEMAGAAAGADAGQDGDAAAEDADFGEGVEVRRVGRFELGQAARLLRQAAEAVGHVHDDLGVVFDVQFAGELVEVHGGRGRGSEVGGQGFIVAKYVCGCKGKE